MAALNGSETLPLAPLVERSAMIPVDPVAFLPVSSRAIVIGVIVLLSTWAWASRASRSVPKGLKAVPGPWGLPFIGRVHDMDPARPWEKVTEWCEEFNGFYQTTMMGEKHLWISDPEIAKDLLRKRAAIYSSRPRVPAVPGSDSQGQYLPLLARDEPWRRQRKFAHTVLSGAHAHHYYGVIDSEAKRFLYDMLQTPEKAHQLSDRFCGRVASRLTYGWPDAGAELARNAHEFIGQISPGGPITNLMPFLGRLPEFLNGSVRDVRLRRERERRHWVGWLARVRRELDENEAAPVSFARTYFERKEQVAKGRIEASHGFEFAADDEEATYAIGMLGTVAIFTIGGPLNCFMMAMATHPQWQAKVREEVDRVLGERVATLADSPSLPTLRAAIKECVRWRPPVPLGVPRLLEQDDEYKGYFLKKGTIAHVVEQALARDPVLYPEPSEYNPGRWLDASYPTFQTPLTEHPKLEGHHQFGQGYRMCPGVPLTEAELLVACSGLLWAFELKPALTAEGEEATIDTHNRSYKIIGGPAEFAMRVEVRSAERAATVARWAAEEEDKERA